MAVNLDGTYQMGLKLPGTPNVLFKRKFRWVMEIDNVSGDAINTLPPQKSARPNINFKTIEAQHLNESIHYPGKPEWKPINLTLYDVIGNAGSSCPQQKHPVFDWLKKIYNPGIREYTGKNGGTGSGRTMLPSDYVPPTDLAWYSDAVNGYKRTARLKMLNGCGDVLEEWIYENAWPEAIEFGDLDYANSEVVTADITLRYDRAYIHDPNNYSGNGLNREEGSGFVTVPGF
jgi:hypothetical protein